MKRLYQAIDGEIFDNEADCNEYEKQISSIPRLADWHGQIKSDWASAVYIELVDDKEVQWFISQIEADGELDEDWVKDIVEDYKWCLENNFRKSYYGFWYYDDSYSVYRHIDSEIVDFILHKND